MLWIKAFHIVFMVTWFAGILYLPRLYVYHAMSEDQISLDRFKIMERKLYYGIMTPGAVLTLITGIWLIHGYGIEYFKFSVWLHVKIMLVAFLVVFHLYCGYLRQCFHKDRNTHSHVFYRFINEIPVILLIAIVLLVILKPF